MTTTKAERPVAVGYVSATDPAERTSQRDALVGYAADEGLRLARTFLDARGGWTISQLVKEVHKHKAAVVLLPAGVHLAEASARVSADLSRQDACCVVVDRPLSKDLEPARPAARLPAGLRRREPVDAATTD